LAADAWQEPDLFVELACLLPLIGPLLLHRRPLGARSSEGNRWPRRTWTPGWNLPPTRRDAAWAHLALLEVRTHTRANWRIGAEHDCVVIPPYNTGQRLIP
jgi:hypothetical protein